jgi:DNA ligase-4
MPLLFVYVCDLLEQLEQIKVRYPPYLPKDQERRTSEKIEDWFRRHRQRIDGDTNGVALLSALLPETRTDRVYELKEKSLEKIIGRAQALPNSRRADLARWRQPGAGDLGDCVERVFRLHVITTSAELILLISLLGNQGD